MINFRYHLISLTAVFLALGIGIAMGSTVVSKATVSGLRSNLATIERNSDATRSENRTLRDELNRYRKQDDELSKLALGIAVRDQLDGVPVVVIASKGIDSASLSKVQSALNDAGARYEGTLLLDRRLDLSGGNADKLASILGITGSGDALRTALAGRLAEVLLDAAQIPSRIAPPTTTTVAPPLTPGAPTTTTVATSGTPIQPDLITDLREAGFLDFQAPDGGVSTDSVLTAPTGGYRYLVVSGAAPDVPNDYVIYPLLRRLAASGPVPVVAASAAIGDTSEDVRMAFVGPIREDDELDGNISTVDDLERYPGLLAAVYGLAEVGPGGGGRHGHYGIGKGASALVPSVSG